LNFARKIKIFGNAAENQFFFKLKKDMVWKWSLKILYYFLFAFSVLKLAASENQKWKNNFELK
jgi:hypothetical protein